jgi:hypothetical protein
MQARQPIVYVSREIKMAKQTTIELAEIGFILKTKRFDPDSGEALPDMIQPISILQIEQRMKQLAQQSESIASELSALQKTYTELLGLQAVDLEKKAAAISVKAQEAAEAAK